MLDTLLPDHATPFLRAMERVGAKRIDLRARNIVDSFDPWACPAEFLPWLAQTRGLDLWYDDWSETTKRRAIAGAPQLQRMKGTLDGLRRYLALVDAEITYTRLPADQAYAGGMTPAQKAEWLSRLPQLRIYPFRATLQIEGAAADQAVAGDEDHLWDFVTLDPALGRIQEQVFLWRAGDEAPLTVLEAETAPWAIGGALTRFAALMPLEATGDYLDGTAHAGDQAAPGAVAAREPVEIARLRVKVEKTGQMQPIEARARTVSAPFELVAQPYEGDPAAPFADHAALARDLICLIADVAPDHVYRRTYLADPEIAVPEFSDGSLMSDVIANLTPVTGLIGIRISRPDPGHHLINTGLVADGYLGSDTMQRDLARAVEAARRAQGGTDIYVIDSTTYTPLTAGDAPRAGDGIPSGKMIERYLQ